MFPKPLNRFATKIIGKVPLQTVLVVPFLVQIVGTVGVVGWLSFQNGQRAVNDVATQLRGEISDRIKDRMENYMSIPHIVNHLECLAAQSDTRFACRLAWPKHLYQSGRRIHRRHRARIRKLPFHPPQSRPQYFRGSIHRSSKPGTPHPASCRHFCHRSI